MAGDEPRALDPALAEDSTTWSYLIQVYSGLVRLDDNLQIQPDLASSWEISPDEKTYTFHLRTDAKFANGKPITAADLAYSLNRTLDPATHSPVAALYLGDIVGASDRLTGKSTEVPGIKVVDPHTLQLTIDAPKSYFLAKLTYPTGFVVDQANVASGANWWKTPNGSGPFTLKSYTPSDSLVLARNPNYYGAKPGVSEVDYYLGPNSAIGMFSDGKLDVVPVGVGDVPRVTDPGGPFHSELQVVPSLSLWYLGFNVKQKPFDDPKVRQAFAYATDKSLLVNGIFHGSRTIAQQILPPGMPGYDTGYPGTTFDPERARQLLSESSYKSAAALPPVVFGVDRGESDLAERIVEMYRSNLGVQVSVVEYENDFSRQVSTGAPGIYMMGWVADYPDPQDFLDILFGPTSADNYSAYQNPTVTRLLQAASAEPDEQKRLDDYRQAQRQILADGPVVPLFHDTQYVLVRGGVSGLKITPLGILSFAGVRVRGT
ncbi:MAG TPA: peptide ABC transporter substrate-binding protein [Chloroflexota bacterium]|nr:peptide ABC transporter substrate-binding protein [Chloroflexota bacterium]